MTQTNFINLTALGAIYGVKGQDVGRWLKGLGLRTEGGRPSRQAMDDGFVQERMLEFGGSHWLWHEAKSCEVLDGMQYPRGGVLSEIEEHDGFVLIRGT